MVRKYVATRFGSYGLIWILSGLAAACSASYASSEELPDLHGAAAVGLFFAFLVGYTIIGLAAVMLVRKRTASGLRQSLRKLRESEGFLRLQFARMPIACVTISSDLEVQTWNPAAERIFGYSASEIIGRSLTLILPQGLTPQLDHVCRRLFEQGDGTAHSVNTNRTRDGRLISCRWTNTPLVDGDRVVGSLCMAEDITEQLLAERTLSEERARHRDLLDALPHFIFSFDNDDRFTAANAAACSFFGRSEIEVIGKTPAELGVPEEVLGDWLDLQAKTRQTGQTQSREFTLQTGDRTGYFRAITSPVRDHKGVIVGVSAISIDTKELKEAEANARRLLQAIEQLDEVVFTTDRDALITYANPAFEKLYGYSRQDVIRQNPRILKSGEYGAEHYAAMWNELRAGCSVRGQYRNRRRDGSIVEVNGCASPVLDDSGAIVGYIAVQQDMTAEIRAAEERLRFNQRLEDVARMEALGTLAGGIAHDFNNILSIILTHVDLLQRRADDVQAVNRFSGIVRQAVHRGASLSRQILTFARRTESKFERVDLKSLIVELHSMIAETFPRTLNVVIELDENLPELEADADQLHQALLNLAVNARDAMPLGGTLTIAARLRSADSVRTKYPEAVDRHHIELSVSDDGVGMDEETRARLFEPFFTTKERGKGTGLGLAVVFGVMKSHGAVIDVISHVGCGTVFTFLLPLEKTNVSSPRQHPETVIAGTEMLMVIDDEPALLHSVSTSLRSYGYQIVTAGDGLEALKTLAKLSRQPDAIIMDVGMPGMSAADLLKDLRRVAPAAPVVAITGYVDPDAHAGVLACGARHVVQKPFDVGELLAAVRESLLPSAEGRRCRQGG